jgi:hypothetical protein
MMFKALLDDNKIFDFTEAERLILKKPLLMTQNIVVVEIENGYLRLLPTHFVRLMSIKYYPMFRRLTYY